MLRIKIGIKVKQLHTETIEESELLISNAESEADIFNELIEGLGVSPIAGSILLSELNTSPQFIKQAEHELLEEVQHRKQQYQVQATSTEGSKRKRPIIMRGIVI